MPIRDAGELQRVLDLAGQYRPMRWVADMEQTRLQYEGHVLSQLEVAAKRRYPMTAHKMPIAPLEWVSLVAFKGSTIYDTPTTRQPLGPDGEELPKESQAALDFAQMIKEAKLDVRMAEADRVRYLAKSVVLYAYSDSIGAMVSKKPPKTSVAVVWAPDLFVIPNPAAPSNLQAAVRVLWRTGDATGQGEQSFMDWRRDVVTDTSGRIIGYGRWQADMVVIRRQVAGVFNQVTESITVTPVWAPYPLERLPFFVAHKGEPSGCPFMTPGGAVKDVANAINTSLMSEMLTVDMTAAPLLVRTSNQPQPSSIGIGPGLMTTLPSGDTLTSVTQTSDLAGIRASNAAMLENLALTERQRVGSFTGDNGVESGIALKVKSLPSEKARREDKNQMRPFEEEELLPGLVEIHDHFRQTSIAAAVSEYRVDFPDPPDFETKAERQTRLAEAVELGWIDKARAATEAAYYDSVDDAEVATSTIAAQREERMASALGGTDTPSERSPDGDSAASDANGTNNDNNDDDVSA